MSQTKSTLRREINIVYVKFHEKHKRSENGKFKYFSRVSRSC
jgi:hypothetical protein